jgi:hypothetical protein
MRNSLAPQVSQEKKRRAWVSDDAAISRLSIMGEPQNAQTTSLMSSMGHKRGAAGAVPGAILRWHSWYFAQSEVRLGCAA